MGDYATPTGTRQFVSKKLGHVASVLGSTNLVVSPFGFGCYRVTSESSTHKDALMEALKAGINLIDTSTNYMDGRSESLVGDVLNEAFQEGICARDQVVVVTKVGYLQGQNLQQAMLRRDQGKPYGEVTFVSNDCWHCIHPEFLDEQIKISLARLRLPTIDVLLLHNPEYFFDKNDDKEEYYRRIKEAFRYLEHAVQDGRIRCYGISSNSFPIEEKDSKFTSLERVWQVAEELSPTHHFKVIQFPFNIFESTGISIRNNGKKTLMAFAETKRLGTLINRPFNAFYGGNMLRLAEYPVSGPVPDKELLTNVLQDTIKPEQSYPTGDFMALGELPVGAVLAQNFNQIANLLTWSEILEYQVAPSLAASLQKSQNHSVWAAQYKTATTRLFQVFSDYYSAIQNSRIAPIKGVLEGKIKDLSKGPLSRQVLQIYLSIPQIHCTLIGMRKPGYVKDVLSTPTDKLKGSMQAPLLAFLHDVRVR